jgi:hypothetical protein
MLLIEQNGATPWTARPSPAPQRTEMSDRNGNKTIREGQKAKNVQQQALNNYRLLCTSPGVYNDTHFTTAISNIVAFGRGAYKVNDLLTYSMEQSPS